MVNNYAVVFSVRGQSFLAIVNPPKQVIVLILVEL